MLQKNSRIPTSTREFCASTCLPVCIYSFIARSVLVPAYDNSLLWEGHASMIWESSTQLPIGVKPDAVVCCVGGAGLAGGVIKGCKDVGWDDGENNKLPSTLRR